MYFGKQLAKIIAVCLFVLITIYASSAQDTIPPVFTTLPKSDSISCIDFDGMAKLQSWFKNSGGAVAVDEGGRQSIVANKTLSQVQAEFTTLFNAKCEKNRRVFVKFAAKDPAGNVSDSVQVYFKIRDNLPIVVKEPDFDIRQSCVVGIKDSLEGWIKKHGNAIITDGCGGKIEWVNFIFNVNGVEGSGNFENGPFPVIPARACNWALDISFFAKDSCGNSKAVTGKYRILDNMPPVLLNTPQDVTVNCMNIPDTTRRFQDFCDPDPSIVFTQNYTRTGDTNSCLYYTYSIQREWIATDKCSNSAVARQKITVLDGGAPIIVAADDLTISCSQVNDPSITLQSIDDCAKFSWSYDDKTIGNGCSYVINRTYSAKDVCNNNASKTQRLFVVDNEKPIITLPPKDTIVIFKDSLSAKQKYESWLQGLAGMKYMEKCNDVDTIILVSNSYDSLKIKSLSSKIPKFENINLCQSSNDTIAKLKFDFIIRDACGNYAISRATFSILDTTPPSFLACHNDLGILISSPECNLKVAIPIPTVSNIGPICQKGVDVFVDDSLVLSKSLLSIVSLNLPAGSRKLIFRIADAAGNTASCQTMIYILDTLKVESKIALCNADTLTLNANLPNEVLQSNAKIVWFKGQDSIGGGNSIIVTSENGTLNGTYRLSVSTTNCSIIDSVTIKTDDVTSLQIVAIDKRICKGEKVNLTTKDFGLGARYVWNSEILGVWTVADTTDSPSLLIDQSLDSVQYFVQVLQNGCVSPPSDTIKVALYQLEKPITSVQDSLVFCEGLLMKIDLVAPVQDIIYSWTGPNGFNAMGQSISVGDSLTKSGKYSVYATKGACKSDSTFFNLVLLAKPLTPKIIGASMFCPESESVLIAETSTTFDSIMWKKNGSVFATTVTDSLLIMDAVGGTYSATSFFKGCSSEESEAFILSIVPSLPIIITQLGGNCQGDSISLEASFVDGTLYSWTTPNGIIANERILKTIATSGKFNLSMVDSLGCKSQIDTTLIAIQKPFIDSLIGTYSSCQDSIPFFEIKAIVNPAEGVNYSWTGPEGFISTNGIAKITITSEAVYGVYTLEAQIEACKSPLKSIEIQKNQSLPKIQISGPKAACLGDTLYFKADKGFDIYNWHTPTGMITIEDSILVIANFSEADSGNYYLRGIAGSCTTDFSDTIVLGLNAKPITPIIAGLSSLCLGSTAILSINGQSRIDSILWKKNGQIFTTTFTDSLFIKQVDSLASANYTATTYLKGCASNVSLPFNLSVASSLPIGITRRGGNCQGDSITLEANNVMGATYVWTAPNGTKGNARIFKVLAQSGKYTLEVDNGQGCKNQIDTNFTILTKPLIESINSTYSPCVDTLTSFKLSAKVTPSIGVKYTWLGPAGFKSNDSIANVAITGGTVFGTYMLEASIGGCIAPLKTIEILKTQPVQKAIIKGPSAACLGDTLFFAANRGYGTYEWQTPTGSITLSDSILLIANVTDADMGTYFVRGKSGTCISDYSDTITLGLVTKPGKPEITGLDSICLGDSLRLSIIQPQTGLTYRWTLPNGSTKETNALHIIDLPDRLRGMYTAQALNGSCKSIPSSAIDVKIKPVIASPTFNAEKIAFCDDGRSEIKLCLETQPLDRSLSYQITAVPSGQILYEGKDSCYSFNSSTITFPITRLRVQSKKENCLSDTFDDVLMNLAQKPKVNADIVPSALFLCNNSDTITLQNADHPDSLLYFWRVFDSGIILENLDSNRLRLSHFTQPVNRVILSLSFDICNNFSRDTFDIKLATSPQAVSDTVNITLADDPFIPFESIVFQNLRAEEKINFLSSEIAEIRETEKGFEIFIKDKSQEKFELKYVLCDVSCGSYCDTSSVFFITSKVDEEDIECKVPNVITPNGDGINDVFTIDCVEKYNENRLQIYTQWGDEVFEASPYTNNWQGEFKNEPLPAGTYFYNFNNGEGKTLTGFLIIQR